MEGKKRKRRRLHVYPRNLLAVSGVIQVSLLTVHIESITRMTTVIVGFYLLAFILASTINILNGYGFTGGGSMMVIAGTLFVTLVQMVFGILYISTILGETAFLQSERVIPQMGYSILLFAGGMLAALLAIFFEFKVYLQKDEIYKYMM